MAKHESVWLATAGHPQFPTLDGDVDVDVAVVGGGIVGLTTALLAARDGAQVAVVEASRIGSGTTGHTTGKVTSQHSLTYRRLIDRHGEQRARAYAHANQAAIATVASIAEEIAGDCRLERAPAYAYTRSDEHRGAIEAEYAAAVRLGLPAHLTAETELPFPVELALRFDGQAHFHPSRYTTALARHLAGRGVRIFEGTRAVDVDERVEHAVVRTATGDVRAAVVVVATLLPFLDAGGFFAKARPSRAYGIAARLGADPPAGMHIDVAQPTRSTRPWRDGDRPGLVVVGENHPTGHGEVTEGAWDELGRWAREHFDVESLEYRWSAQDYSTVDDVPYVGRSPRLSRVYVATGFKKWGLTNGTAAARILVDGIAGRANPWAEAFDATRIGDAETVRKLVEENLHVGRRFVKDRIARLHAAATDHLAPGDGGMVEVDGVAVGAYRDPAGAVHAVSLTCTHLACTVHWNAAERSWDCPCHGSRFDVDGSILEGPAVRPLERVDVDLEA